MRNWGVSLEISTLGHKQLACPLKQEHKYKTALKCKLKCLKMA